jgi:DNA-binding MarR family transcriptional regulator
MKSIIPLIEHWENYSHDHADQDIYAFASWLLASRQRSALAGSKSATIGVLLTKLQKYLGLIVKPEIRKLGLAKEHEYSFLYQVSNMQKPNKNQLARENLLELSTGRDVVNRLVNKGLITEKPDPADGRAMLINITSKGSRLLKRSFKLLATPFSDFAGDLTVKEQETLVQLLTKMERYHAIKRGQPVLDSL